MKPKVAVWSYAVGALEQRVKEDIAQADVLVSDSNPQEIAELRRINPKLKHYFKVEPQHVKPWEFRWETDLPWNPTRRWEKACAERGSDFNLRRTNGAVISDGVKNIVNWTPYSTAPRAWAAMIESVMEQNHWSSENDQGVNGLAIEVMADCLGSMAVPGLNDADPDRDGIAERVTKACSAGGRIEPLSVLMKVGNAQVEHFVKRWSDQIRIVMNDHVYHSGPSWAIAPDSKILIKQENWLRKVLNAEDRVLAYREQVALPNPFAYCYTSSRPWGVEDDAGLARLTIATALRRDCHVMLTRPGERKPFRVPELDVEMGDLIMVADTKGHLIFLMFELGTIAINIATLDATWHMQPPERGTK